MQTIPLVSVIVPAHNHDRFVAQALRSIAGQTYRQVELVIIDDGSTDRTAEVIARELTGFPFPYRFESQSNAGLPVTLNRAISLAQGEYLSFLASDDRYALDFIETNVRAMLARDGGDVVQHSDAFLLEDGGAVTGRLSEVTSNYPAEGSMFEEVLRSDAFILSASIFLSKSVMARAGGFDPAMLAEDFDLHLRLSRFVSFRFINQPIYFSRHTTGSLGKKPWLWGEDIIASIEKHTDLLGDSLSPILSDRSRRLALACFEYGAWRDGWRWVHRSMTYLPGTHSKLAAFAGGVLLAGRALARQAAFLILGRSQLVRLKRKLKRA